MVDLNKKIIAGNWKMVGDLAFVNRYGDEFLSKLSGAPLDAVSFIIFPSAPFIIPLKDVFDRSSVAVGCQNIYFEKEGAYTGEVASTQLKSLGCDYCLVGHSERRKYFSDTDEWTALKVAALLSCKITPVLCIGETLAERDNGETFKVLERQLKKGLENVSLERDSVIIAYEPVWAIGTGRNATADQIIEAHTWIRQYLSGKCGDRGAGVPILYGGSVKSSNSRETLACENVNGVLVGGASLKVDEFLSIAGSAR